MYMESLTAGADPGASTLEAVDLLHYLMKVLSPQQRVGPNAALGFPIQVAFLSAFFTSAWLWIYVGAVYAARFLLRMNSGVGVLLRATDLERHPFRSMGFVSVIITSALFLLALPLVLF